MIEQEIAAGWELDALVAERVMGWHREGKGWWTSPGHRQGFNDWEAKGEHDLLESSNGTRVWFCGCHPESLELLPAYSTEIAAAWLVVEKMTEKGYGFSLTRDGNGWTATFPDDDRCTVHSLSAPRAIVRAALEVFAEG